MTAIGALILIMAVNDTHVVSWLSHASTYKTFFWKLPTTLLTCIKGERRIYCGKKVQPTRVLNSQPPGHEYDTLTTEHLGQGLYTSI